METSLKICLRFVIIWFCSLLIGSCISKSRKPANTEIITYGLEEGYKAFVEDTTSHNDSLATAQALFLVKEYGDDGITQVAPGTKSWLKARRIDGDSVRNKASQDRKDFTKERENSPGNTDDAYEKLHIAFEGMPEVEKIKPLLDAVMTRYNVVINNENVLKTANVLVVFKSESKVGATEMDMLKHIYQKGSLGGDYVTQAAISSLYLEGTK